MIDIYNYSHTSFNFTQNINRKGKESFSYILNDNLHCQCSRLDTWRICWRKQALGKDEEVAIDGRLIEIMP